LSRSRTLERRLAERVHIVPGAAQGRTTVEVAGELGVDAQRVARWRSRFAAAHDPLAAVTTADVPDEERSGSPGKFTAQQLAQPVALACREAEELGLPVTHWTPREVAACAQQRGIVASISPRRAFSWRRPTSIRTGRATG